MGSGVAESPTIEEVLVVKGVLLSMSDGIGRFQFMSGLIWAGNASGSMKELVQL